MRVKVLKVILYICGIFCIVYPIYSKFLSFKSQTEIISNYNKEIESMDKEILEDKLKKSEEFNDENASQIKVVDPNEINVDDASSSYSFLELGEMVGTINIPKININLPIYEGITSTNLTKGVAHMEDTSLPNGDINTHSILAGHTGISQAEIFDNLNELEIYDEFYISFYGNITKYRVIEKRVVLPDDTSILKIEENRCLVTLVTCTPKTVNTHRLLVTGEKIEEEKEIKEEKVEDNINLEIINEKSDFELFIDFIKKNKSMMLFVFIVIIILIIISIIQKITKRKKEN